jgi:hypothetical protein
MEKEKQTITQLDRVKLNQVRLRWSDFRDKLFNCISVQKRESVGDNVVGDNVVGDNVVVDSWQTYWSNFKICRTKKIRFHFWSIKQKKKVHWCKKVAIRNVKFRFFWETQKKKIFTTFHFGFLFSFIMRKI